MSILPLDDAGGLTENRVQRWVCSHRFPTCLGQGDGFVQVGSPGPFCVVSQTEPVASMASAERMTAEGKASGVSAQSANEVGEVAVGGKRYGGHCHHARYEDYGEH